MIRWQAKQVPFVYTLGEWQLLHRTIPMQAASIALGDDAGPGDVERLDPADLDKSTRGYLIRMLPVDGELPIIEHFGPWLRYCFMQYRRCYVDLGQTFDDYVAKFSAKTRSTLRRKVKKYAEHCGGRIRFEVYQTRAEVRTFLAHAHAVSKLSYQERLLHMGIPATEAFIGQAGALADGGNLMAYVLFDGERPVSYLYCPVKDGIVGYAYLGYDPDYAKLSVGAVLHWLAIEQLFGTGRFRYLDFGEGESEHKLLFSTAQQHCVDMFLFRNTLRNKLLVVPHMLLKRFSTWTGALLERMGLKRAVRKFLRRAT
ncbi:MAG: GNAT family N-acetyltransferase [Xanthomonadales bacterium]|nr:GNAT family N-acetyltransferase [Xanthomonadales bacterium]ODU92596.1 MAG: hypothetical protein ABT18_11255 [Rhodanobacter sp. SCN 66-43]OJY85461.1 MAG: hypothetical protein BGP23_00540 [Xanthomonadales bacterium 66-474]